MKVTYGIVEVAPGAGQTAWLASLILWSIGKWDSTVVAKSVAAPGTSLISKSSLIKSDYFSSVFDERVKSAFREADVVHIKSGWPFYIIASHIGTPTIYTLHGPDPTWLFSGRKRVNLLLASLAETRLPLRHASAVVSVSEWVAEWYKRHRNIRSTVIPDAIDLTLFGRDHPRSWSGAGPQLLCIGEWDGWKGRKRTHDLFPLLRSLHGVFPQATLTLAGLSQESIQELGQLVGAFRLDSHVRLLGRLPNRELAGLYRSADIYVSPTIVEGFYRPIVEAFASGLPAVVRDARNIVDPVNQSPLHHVLQSGGGETYDGSPDAFVCAIRASLEKYERLSAHAVEYARKFDLNRVLPLYQRLYEKLATE